MAEKITSIEQLTVWQEAQDLAVDIYKLTRPFPKEEIFGLTSQIRRAAYSVSANIAEGFGRSTSKDKYHFYTIAYGSLLEVKNFLYLSHRLEYISRQELDKLLIKVVSCQKLLNAFKAGVK